MSQGARESTWKSTRAALFVIPMQMQKGWTTVMVFVCRKQRDDKLKEIMHPLVPGTEAMGRLIRERVR